MQPKRRRSVRQHRHGVSAVVCHYDAKHRFTQQERTTGEKDETGRFRS